MRKNVVFMLYLKDIEKVKNRVTTFCFSEWIVWRCEEYARKVRRQKRKERILKCKHKKCSTPIKESNGQH